MRTIPVASWELSRHRVRFVTAVQNRWTQYCQELYNYPIQPDDSLLDRDSTSSRGPSPLPVMREEVEEALGRLPEGKSPGADNIPSELLKHAGNELVTIVTSLCQKIWESKQWPAEWTQSLIIPLPKRGNLR